jgi:hypothetical protein
MDKEIGLRVTQDISKIEKNIVIDALNIYFGNKRLSEDSNYLRRFEAKKLEDESLKNFSRKADLFCYIVRISDNMNSSEYDSEKTVNAFDAHLGTKCQYSDGINNNMLLRSLGSSEIPFHAFKIDFSVIERALKTLAFRYYLHLHIWYFDAQEIDFPAIPKRELKKLLAYYHKSIDCRESQIRFKYMKAWRSRRKALDMLRIRIIDILQEG